MSKGERVGGGGKGRLGLEFVEFCKFWVGEWVYLKNKNILRIFK